MSSLVPLKFTPPPSDEAIAALLSPELLQVLDILFPERCPHYSDPINQIMYRSGERNVVNVLRAKYEKAQQNILE